MKRIRIGNDVRIVWTLTRNGEAESLEGRDLRVRLVHDMSKASVPFEWACIGQAVVGTFQGKDQEKTGRYSLVVAENAGRADMHTLDHAGALMLVDRSWKADGEDEGGCSNVTVETVELADDLQFARDGRSAYELALLHGFEGTEDEYALEYVRAREAAERASAEASAAVEVSGRAAEQASAAVEAAERASAEASAAVEVSGRAAEQAGSALRLVDETVMRVYRNGGYNMDRCLWYGWWFGCTSGRPSGSSDGEEYALEVVNCGCRRTDFAAGTEFPEKMTNRTGADGGWDGTFGYYNVRSSDGVATCPERYYGNYPAAGEEVCRRRIEGLVAGALYEVSLDVAASSTRERDSWLPEADLEADAFRLTANGEGEGWSGLSNSAHSGTPWKSAVRTGLMALEVTCRYVKQVRADGSGCIELKLWAGGANTANWFVIHERYLRLVEAATEERMVLKQTCHSCLDVGRVFHRLVYTKDRNVFEAPVTVYGAWERVTADVEARLLSLEADEATVEDVEALD